MKLFCLPFAGGASTFYYDWKQDLSSRIEVIPLELKGRGSRFNEVLCSDFEEMVDDIFIQIRKYELNDYIIFGHSMGALLSYELTMKLALNEINMPMQLILSGCRPPHLFHKREIYPNVKLSNYQFIKEISKLGGIPSGLLDNKELVNIFGPILKNDISNLKNYSFYGFDRKIVVPATVLIGKQDSISFNEALEWQKCFNEKIAIMEYDGGHFFIDENRNSILDYISNLKKN